MNSRILTTTLFLLLLPVALPSVLAQTTDKTWTVQECIDYALENNLTVKNQELTVNINEVNRHQSRMNLLPTLNAGANYGYNWGRSINPETNLVTKREQTNGFGNLNLNWTLFSGWRNVNGIKQANANLAAREYDLETTKNNITLSIITLYTTVIFNTELLENARLQLESTRSQMERTRKQVEAGSLPRSNLLDMQAQVASSELNVINAENNLNIALLQLKQAMLYPENEPLQIEIPQIEINEVELATVTPENVYKIAASIMPEVKGAEMNLESSLYGIKVAKGSYYPRISLSAGLNTNYSSLAADRGLLEGTGNFIEIPIGYVQGTGDVVVTQTEEFIRVPYELGRQLDNNFGQSVGLSISIPIFNNHQVKASVQRAKIAYEQAKVQAELTRQNLRQTIERAYYDAYSAAKAYQSSLKRVEAQEESFRAMKQRYENGAANATDYELAENNLFQAKSDLLRAKYDFIFKLKILDFYQGKPIEF